jgi:hypothetical protein
MLTARRHRYAVAITSRVRARDGEALAVPPGFAALRDGKHTDHELLEAMRPTASLGPPLAAPPDRLGPSPCGRTGSGPGSGHGAPRRSRKIPDPHAVQVLVMDGGGETAVRGADAMRRDAERHRDAFCSARAAVLTCAPRSSSGRRFERDSRHAN